MDSLRQIEEDLRNFGMESKKKYPEVIDATERALGTLKMMREMYVSDKMRKTGMEKEDVKIPQSSDILAPYLLACNYVDANPKLILMALSGIQLVVNYEVAPLSDVKNVLRIFDKQASTGTPELQRKILQILLQLVTLASRTEEDFQQYFNETTIKEFLSMTLSMCDESKGSLSVSSTALATSRQVIAIMLDSLSPSSGHSVVHLIEDLCLFIQGRSGEWNKGLVVPSSYAFDLLDYMMDGWKEAFTSHPKLCELVKTRIFSTLKPKLQKMQGDFCVDVTTHGVGYAAAQSYRVVRLARHFILNFTREGFTEEIDILVTLMIHFLTSDDSRVDAEGFGLEEAEEASGPSLIGAGAALIGGLQGGLQRLAGSTFAGNVGSPRSDGSSVGAAGNKRRSLQSCYLVLSGSTEDGAADFNARVASFKILAHPAGLCLEALLAFFMRDIFRLVYIQKGSDVMVSSMTNAVVSLSSVLSKALSIPHNVATLGKALDEGMTVMNILEDAIAGKETNVDSVIQALNEHLGSSAGERVVSNEEVLVLSLHLLQVIVRRVLEGTIDACAESNSTLSASTAQKAHFFLVSEGGGAPAKKRGSSGSLTDLDIPPLQLVAEAVDKVCSGIYESVQDVCMSTLSALSHPGVVRRQIGVLSEMALVAGLLRRQRPCEVIVASLCRFTVPRWHSYDTIEEQHRPDRRHSSRGFVDAGDVYQWRHVQATARLLQCLHVLADHISDWDSIVDAMEQIVQCLISPQRAVSDDVTSGEIDKILSAIDRFKEYTVYLSDDALIKLMSSLVAMSLNNLAVTAKSSSSSNLSSYNDRTEALRGAVKDLGIASLAQKNNRLMKMPPYMIEGISVGAVSFSLQAAVEVAKINSFRIACIWQMVTSHLRMVASLKSEVVRAVAVNATHDMISIVTKYQHQAQPPSMEIVGGVSRSIRLSLDGADMLSSDEVLFSAVMPSFQTSFLGRQLHAGILKSRLAADEKSSVKLSQEDVLGCLKTLSSVRYDDVKLEIMKGLLELLQSHGDILGEGGWATVITVIAMAPQSLCSVVEDPRGTPSPVLGTDEDNKWPHEAMELAFTCMKLIVDEYTEIVSQSSVNIVIDCCAAFSQQPIDVNISLTALEMLWKVYDQMMRTTHDGESHSAKRDVFEMTMRKLLSLSMDVRPEIRNCATNTLFAAMTLTSNAALTSGEQWCQIFDEVIFPLFERAGERSNQAMESNEEAIAPELKKGTKMILHHSRDTAHKQWSETRLLALRGLTRVINTCTSLLLGEVWFHEAWAKTLEICKKSSHVSIADMEVAIGSLDVMFSMLKVVSTSASKISGGEMVESATKTLWIKAWEAIYDVCRFDFPAPELALHISQSLLAIYSADEDGSSELLRGTNLSTLCLALISIARPRMSRSEDSSVPNFGNEADQILLMRSIVEFAQALKNTDEQARAVISSALVQLCFSGQFAQCVSPITGNKALLDASPLKFREDIANLFVTSSLGANTARRSPMRRAELVDTVYSVFITNVCGPAIALRSEDTTCNDTPQKTRTERSQPESPSVELGFFSFLSGPLDEEFGDDPSKKKIEGDEPSGSCVLPIPFTTFDFPKTNDCRSSWTTFYDMSVECEVLINTINEAIGKDNLEMLSDSTVENIFSSLLCILSPWHPSELPGIAENPGAFVETFERGTKNASDLVISLYAKCSDDVLAAGWTRALIETLFLSVRLQIFAIAQESPDADCDGLIVVWKHVSKIFSEIAEISPLRTLRRKAVTALLELSKDFSLQAISSTSNVVLEAGCKIFVGQLLDTRTHIIDVPHSFTSTASDLNSTLRAWITCLEYDITPIEANAYRTTEVEGVSMRERGALYLFLPVAFQLLASRNEEIRGLGQRITSSIDIAQLVSSYTELLRSPYAKGSTRSAKDVDSLNERF